MKKRNIVLLLIILLTSTVLQCERNSLYKNYNKDDLISLISSDLESLLPSTVDINIQSSGINYPTASVYDFGPVIIGNTSPAVTFTIQNLGGTDLVVSGPPVAVMGGTNPADFSPTDPAVTTLAPGASTTFTVTFAPGALGVRRAIMTITSNDPDEAVYTINLMGTGSPVPVPDINVQVVPTDYASGSTYNFGSVMLGNSSPTIVFTIQNLGTAPLNLSLPLSLTGGAAADFTMSGPGTAGIPAGASETFTLSFSPGANGVRSALLTITSDDPDEASYEINLTGTGVPVPVPDINMQVASVNCPSGGSYDFGSYILGDSSVPVTFTIENLGTADLTITSVPTISGTNAGDFTLAGQPAAGTVIGIGGSLDFTVTYSPTTEGGGTATLEVTSDDPDEGTYEIFLSGTGLPVPEPEINILVLGVDYPIGSTFGFGSVLVGDGLVATFTVENTGTADLNLSAPTVSGANPGDFTATSPASLIPAGSSDTFTVAFNPSAAGSRTALLTIVSDDADESPYTINLAGTGVVPDINVHVSGVNYQSGASVYDFPDVLAGDASPAITFTIQNLGSANLTLDGTPPVQIGGTNPGDFVISQPGITVLTPGLSTTFMVNFTPIAVGTRKATITIPNSDPDSYESPYTIDFTGIGLPTVDFPTLNLVAMYLLEGDGSDAMLISNNLSIYSGSPLFNADHLQMTAFGDDVLASLVGTSSGDDATIAINFYPTSTAPIESNFFAGGLSTRWICFSRSATGGVTVRLTNGAYTNTFTATSILNQWNSFVCRINMATTTMTVWTNGVMEQWVFDPAFASFTQATFGIQNHSTGEGFVGLVDNIFIYNRVLSDAEVTAVLGVMR